MEQISKAVNQVLLNGQTRDSRERKPSMEIQMIANLWVKMIHLYAHKWASAFGESAIDQSGAMTATAQTWASGLYGITGDQLASGLRGCLERDDAWPPTLPEFRQLCTGKGLNEFGLTYTPECYRVSPELDKSRLLSSDDRDQRREDGKSKISELKESLR